jgi:hypothetical protein
MKTSALLSLLLGFSSWLCAAPAGPLVLPSQADKAAVAVSITQPADYLCAAVEISSSEKDATTSAEGVKRTLATLAAEIAKVPVLELHRGAVLVSPEYGKGSYSSRSPMVSARVFVLLRLDPTKTNPLDGTALIRRIVARVKPEPGAALTVESIGLAVDSPESRRAELIKRIGVEAAAMRAAFDGATVTVSGLESPVLVRQVDDTRVELFIGYELGVTK